MRFETQVVSPEAYDQWLAGVKAGPGRMDGAAFKLFATPSINYGQTSAEYASVQDGLFEQVMQSVMAGDVYPTPQNMTEKKAHKLGDGKQQTNAVAPLGEDQ